MTRVLASLLLGLTLIVAPAFAQEQDNVSQSLLLVHDCGPAERVLPHLKEKWGELPFALGTAVVVLQDGSPAEGVLMMNVNPKTLSYTVNIMFVNLGIVCMLTSGKDFQPAQSQPGIKL